MGSSKIVLAGPGIGRPARRQLGRTYRKLAAVASVAVLAHPAFAQSPPPAPAAPGAPKLEIELNKVEANEKGCQLSFVVNNSGTDEFSSIKLDLVVFQPDGVIGTQLPLELAGIRGAARTVKKFVFKGLACDRYGSVMINGVMDCKTAQGPVDRCLDGITVNSLVPNVPLTKF